MSLKDSEVATLLIQEHSFLKAEIVSLSNNYKSHVQYSQIGITAIIALFGFMFQTAFQPGASFVVFLMYASTVFVGYAAFTILETQHLINTLGAYLSVQEEKINLLAEKDVLFWETILCPLIFNLPSVERKLRYPGTYLFIFQILMMSVILVAIPFYFLADPTKYHAERRHVVAAWIDVTMAIATLVAIIVVTSDVLGKDNLWKRTRTDAVKQSYTSFKESVTSSRSANAGSDIT